MTRLRWLLLLLVVGTLPAATPARADSSSSVAVSADADSKPVEVTFTAPGVSGTPLVDGRYPHAQSDVSSPTDAHALASVLDPGALVQTGPGQARQAGVPAPSYPFVASADSGQPDASGSVGGQQVGPLQLAGGSYQAHVSGGSASAVATGASTKLALGPGGITVGGGEAHATASADSAGAVAARVQQSLSGLTLFGQFQIDELVSTASASVNPDQPGQATGSLSIGRVTVMGQQAAIDQQGIHVAGQSAPLPSPPAGSGAGLPVIGSSSPAQGPASSTPGPAQQFLSALQVGGIQIRVLPGDNQPGDGQVAYKSSAIEVTQTFPDGTTAAVLLGALSLNVTSHSQAGFGAGSLFGDLGNAEIGGAGAGAGAGQGGAGAALKGRLVGLLTTPHAILYGLLTLFLLSALAGSVIGTLRPSVQGRAATLVRL